MTETLTPPVALSIAGSDSGAGAGVQADLKAMAWLGVHGTTAITSLTAQNSRGVEDIHPAPSDFVRAQIEAVTSDFNVKATKTGMLFSAGIMDVVVEVRDRLGDLVVDPVMVAESGDSLFDEGAESMLVDELLPRADVITPNVSEARIIAEHLGIDERSPDQLGRPIADSLAGPKVLIKGGHTDDADAVDYMIGPGGTSEEFRSIRLETDNTHGSGCAYSSLIVANLARGLDHVEAIREAKDVLTERIESGYSPGAGPGTLNFLRED